MTASAPAPHTPEPVLPPSPPPAEPQASAPAEWGLARRIAFRFVFAYLVLLFFPFPVDILPGGDTVSEAVESVWYGAAAWVGKHVLHLATDIIQVPTGSGDTPFNYVQLFMVSVLAVGVAAVWSVVDRRRTQYVKAHDGLRTYVRYLLLVTMLSYGMSKVFKTQFPFPHPERMLQPLGEFSPMGLVWTFMGFSTGYNVFTGGAEVLGGVLMALRRTTTLGALVIIGVMSNVVALNFFYDIPVKLYSTHLLLMAVFLLLPDLRRLANVLVFNRPTEPAVLRTPFQLSRKQEWAVRTVAVLFVAWNVYSMASARLEGRSKWGDAMARPALFGIYEVESFARGGQAVAPPGDTTAWRHFVVNRFSYVTVRQLDGTVRRHKLVHDPEKMTVTLSENGPASVLAYTQPDPEHLFLQGTFHDAPIEVRLKKVDESSFTLLNRGFNWVQEFPFNR